MERFKESPVFFYEVYNIFFRHHLSVDTDTFAKIDKVRRSIKPHPIACFLQNSGKRMGAGAFTVRSSYMNGTVFTMRMSEVFI